MYPGDPDGSAAEVVNCRCALLQRARWALDESEPATLKERAEYYGLDKTENFNEYKEKYLKVTKEPLEKTVNSNTIGSTVVKDAIDSGGVSKEINVNKQNSHIKYSKTGSHIIPEKDEEQ